ncbi:cytochrome P450 [Polyangium mundeleinium]|uniref:Cytochrome P450 n=1 Tax=Polyangium mundeleinium TaxID=2995306 RepID=A0ABT5ES60_9BACT|nr:cytochrome P450 [Polyangium mundeleinium]MDC0744653.1 cytochrome P450 [Polyangium mundeleinium]
MRTKDDSRIELDDVQGHLLLSYGKTFGMRHARFVFLHFEDVAAGRRWIAAKIPDITTARAAPPGPASTLNLAFTFEGLEALGLAAEELDSFPEEFRQGMAKRAVLLGDIGEDAPERWDLLPHGAPPLHAMAIVYARSQAEADARANELCAEVEATRTRILHVQTAAGLEGGREHFGFADGGSNPSVAGDGSGAPPGRVLEPGAFLLDHPDDFGAVASRPSPKELRRNGTYLALRKLRQDVPGFRRFVAENAAMLGMDAELVAAKLMGRWRSGVPLVLAPEKDEPNTPPERRDDFAYRTEDPQGLRCPFGAHIRRANPRDARPIARRTAVGTHRLLRRGMAYGPPLPEGQDEDHVDRGLIFIAYCASLSLQFEIVQQWLNNGNVSGEPSTVHDPVVGSSFSQGTFTVPVAGPNGELASVHTLCGLPSFVRARGGAYFFVPGINALRYLVNVVQPETQPIEKFLPKYALAQNDEDKKDCVEACLLDPVTARRPFCDTANNWRALRKQAPIFETPHGVLVSRWRDVQEVLAKPEIFSVQEYDARMAATVGPFFLGFDGERHKREASIARLVIRPRDLPRVLERARFVTHVLLDLAKKRAHGEPDFVPQIVIASVVRTAGEYFGVPGPSDEDLFLWLSVASAYIFFPLPSDERAAAGAAAGIAFQQYLDELLRAREMAIATGTSAGDDVLGRLLALPAAHGLDRAGIRRTLGGLVSGTIVPTAMTLLHALAYLQGAREAAEQAREAAAKRDMERLKDILLEAARFDPYPSLLYRTAMTDCELAAGTPRATRIGKGSRVIVSLASAMADEEALEHPEAFQPGRPDEHSLLFGHGSHACIGRFLAGPLMAEIAAPLLALGA